MEILNNNLKKESYNQPGIIDKKDQMSNFDYYDRLIEIKHLLRTELKRKTQLAFMGEIVTSTKEKPIVGTTGLATCNGIIFYDRKNRKAWVGHGPASSSHLTLMEMLTDIKDVTGDLEYSIIPGYDNLHNKDLKESERLRMLLYAYCPKQIKLIPMNNLTVRLDKRANPSYEFAFNAETGESVTNNLFYDDDYMNKISKNK